MENFSQEDVDRMIQEAAMAARNKKPDLASPAPKAAPNIANTQSTQVTDLPKPPVQNKIEQQPQPQKAQSAVTPEPAPTELNDGFSAGFDFNNDSDGLPDNIFDEQTTEPEEEVVVVERQANIPAPKVDTIPSPVENAPASNNKCYENKNSFIENTSEIQTFICNIIGELAQAKISLATVQIELEMEKLKNQARSFFHQE